MISSNDTQPTRSKDSQLTILFSRLATMVTSQEAYINSISSGCQRIFRLQSENKSNPKIATDEDVNPADMIQQLHQVIDRLGQNNHFLEAISGHVSEII